MTVSRAALATREVPPSSVSPSSICAAPVLSTSQPGQICRGPVARKSTARLTPAATRARGNSSATARGISCGDRNNVSASSRMASLATWSRIELAVAFDPCKASASGQPSPRTNFPSNLASCGDSRPTFRSSGASPGECCSASVTNRMTSVSVKRCGVPDDGPGGVGFRRPAAVARLCEPEASQAAQDGADLLRCGLLGVGDIGGRYAQQIRHRTERMSGAVRTQERLGTAQNANDGVRTLELLRRSVVKQDRIRDVEGQPQLSEQCRTDLSVDGSQPSRVLRNRSPRRVCLCRHQRAECVRHGRQKREGAEVVQQPCNVGLLRSLIRTGLGQGAAKKCDAKRVDPELAEFPCGQGRGLGSQRAPGRAHEHRLHQPGANCGGALGKRQRHDVGARCPWRVNRGVKQAQGQDGIQGDPFAHLPRLPRPMAGPERAIDDERRRRQTYDLEPTDDRVDQPALEFPRRSGRRTVAAGLSGGRARAVAEARRSSGRGCDGGARRPGPARRPRPRTTDQGPARQTSLLGPHDAR